MWTPDRQITPDDDDEIKCLHCKGAGKLSDCCKAKTLHAQNPERDICTECGRRTDTHYCKVCRGDGAINSATYDEWYG